MKDRSTVITTKIRLPGTILILALACLVLLPQMRAAPAPNPPVSGSPSNTADGFNALFFITTGTGEFNTADGWFSQAFNVDGNFNTAVGAGSLDLNDSGFNSALGAGALLLNRSPGNTAVGSDALIFNDSTNNHTAQSNTAVGAFALENNTDGDSNTGVGAFALFSNTTSSGVSGVSNNAVGRGALGSNTTGSFNEALGVNALNANTNSNQNVAIGDDAMLVYTGPGTGAGGNTAVGGVVLAKLVSGTLNTAVGLGAGDNYATTESGNIIIGSNVGGTAGENNTIRVGSNLPSGGIAVSDKLGVSAFVIAPAFTGGGIQYLQTPLGDSVTIAAGFPTTTGASHCLIGGIFNQTPLAGSHTVVVAPNGTLADATLSSRRFKKDIAPIDKISEGILALKPVTFHWKSDTTNEPEFGLVAEEVAKVNPAWATRDSQGEISGVRYEAIPILLLNEFLKEHKKVEEQQASIAELKSTVAQQQKGMEVLTAQLKEQAAQIQKVSAQLEMSKPAPQVVTNKP